MNFELSSPFQPTGDQPQAIDQLTSGLRKGAANQVLLGVTGSGKTFTMANVIQRLKRPTLIISHNKTLAAQLYQEFRSFFPHNAVCYFVSYYDYYQPEAYVPQTDTYIEKETEINKEIDKLRLAATANLLSRKDTIIVSSVSCIYNIGSPKEYGGFVLELKPGVRVNRESVMKRLVEMQYARSDYGFHRGTFRVRGETIDIFPSYEDHAIRLLYTGEKIAKMSILDPLNGDEREEMDGTVVYPAKHYMTDLRRAMDTFSHIRNDLEERVKFFKGQGKLLEAHRLNQKVNFDLEMIQELGYVNGIENYSRYFDGRKPGEAPFTLLDYFKEPYKDDWLLFIDESHMTMPQVRGMYNGDRARKQTLIDFGFRLPAALDNRPLMFDEFLRRMPQTVYVSATPAPWEISRAKEEAHQAISHYPSPITQGIIQQLVRPTGILDPEIEIRPTRGQVIDLVKEILVRKQKNERVLVTTLTKRMAEDLSAYLQEKKYLDDLNPSLITHHSSPFQYPTVHYLHADVQTLERSDILDDLRKGTYDVVVGINLLREGLDLPEVSLVAILDADKEGFLRSETSLIQTMGRAARHIQGKVIMYADTVTGSMKRAIDEIDRRRNIQITYNKKHKITPIQITKPVRDKLVGKDETEDTMYKTFQRLEGKFGVSQSDIAHIDPSQLTPRDAKKLVKTLERDMKQAAHDLQFEIAAALRDKIKEIKNLLE